MKKFIIGENNRIIGNQSFNVFFKKRGNFIINEMKLSFVLEPNLLEDGTEYGKLIEVFWFNDEKPKKLLEIFKGDDGVLITEFNQSNNFEDQNMMLVELKDALFHLDLILNFDDYFESSISLKEMKKEIEKNQISDASIGSDGVPLGYLDQINEMINDDPEFKEIGRKEYIQNDRWFGLSSLINKNNGDKTISLWTKGDEEPVMICTINTRENEPVVFIGDSNVKNSLLLIDIEFDFINQVMQNFDKYFGSK